MPDNSMEDDARRWDVDELARLRAADPVPPDIVRSLHRSAHARALFEEIIMDTDTTSDPARPRPRRAALLVAAGTLALAVVGTVYALSDTIPGPDDTIADGGTGDEISDPGPVTSGGMGSCAFAYDATTLAEREHAFIGTVTAVAGDDITFDVEESLRGDRSGTVTLGGATLLTGVTSAGDAGIGVGDRVLVAGDGDFAWSCGFTQPFDETVASDWRTWLAGS